MKLLNTQQVAKRLGCSSNHVLHLTKRGVLESYEIDNRTRAYDESIVQDYIEQQKQQLIKEIK